MKENKYLLIHHSESPKDKTQNSDIYKWHKTQGWSKEVSGFHVVINGPYIFYNNAYDKVVFHCNGHNDNSIAVCVVGDYSYEYPCSDTITSLEEVIEDIRTIYPNIIVMPHCLVNGINKVCPGKNLVNILKDKNYV